MSYLNSNNSARVVNNDHQYDSKGYPTSECDPEFDAAALAYANSVALLAAGGTPGKDEEAINNMTSQDRKFKVSYDFRQLKKKQDAPVNYTGKAKEDWDDMYALLVDYHKRSGDCYFLNPTQYPDGSVDQQLSNWTKNQRRLRSKLMPEQRKLLDKINFDWSDQRIMAFRNRTHKQNNKEYNKLWGNYNPKNNHQKWLFMYEKLKAFKEEFGHVDIPIRWGRDPALGKWVSRQRETRRNLKPEYVDKLSEVGFKWRLKHKGPATPKHLKYDSSKLNTLDTDDSESGGPKYEKQWAENFHKIMAYKEIHGHCLIPMIGNDVKQQKEDIMNGKSKTTVIFDDYLGRWAHKQRLLYGRRDLRKDREEKLEQIGFFSACANDDEKDSNVNEKGLEEKTPPPKRLGKRVMPTAKHRIAFKASATDTIPPTSASTATASSTTNADSTNDNAVAVTPTPPRPNLNVARPNSKSELTNIDTQHPQQALPPWMANLHARNSNSNVQNSDNDYDYLTGNPNAGNFRSSYTPQQQSQMHMQYTGNPLAAAQRNFMNTSAVNRESVNRMILMNNSNLMRNGLINNNVTPIQCGTQNSGAMNNSFVLINNSMTKSMQDQNAMDKVPMQDQISSNPYFRHVVVERSDFHGNNHDQVAPFSPAATKTGLSHAPSVALASTPARVSATANAGSPASASVRESPPDSEERYRRVDPFAVSSSFDPAEDDSESACVSPGTRDAATPKKRFIKLPDPKHHSLNLYYASENLLVERIHSCGEAISPAWKRKRKWRMICT